MENLTHMEGVSQPSYPSFSEFPYKERWEPLKPFLEEYYLVEKLVLKDLVGILKSRHHFWASESQYKRQFRIWNWKRNVPTTKKATICNLIQTRAQLGKSSVVEYKGQEVDKKKLRRYMKAKARQDHSVLLASSPRDVGIELLSGHALQCGNRLFMNWNMPFIGPLTSPSMIIDHTSPFASTPASDIMVATPSSAHLLSSAHSPMQLCSPRDEPSPTTLAILDTTKIARTGIFLQGRHTQLLEVIGLQEKIALTDWMHQFWLFAFVSAKNWNRGPYRWTSSLLGFDSNSDQTAEIDSSRSLGPEPLDISRSENVRIRIPPSLCNWSIHTVEVPYQRLHSPPPIDVPEDNNPSDEGSWKAWTNPETIEEFTEALQSNLESNEFSNISHQNLPVSPVRISETIARDPNELRLEAFGFAIMGRNEGLVLDMLEHNDLDALPHSGIFPLHLAATYLDGSKTCCNILSTLMDYMIIGEASIRKLYTNHLGHTVLDNLMITILKAHTSCLPGVVDDGFKMELRFMGEEVDVCGRWDADSECIRQLHASGRSGIPFKWKHMFCHTSVQVICHSMGALFSPRWAPDINISSGLFMKRCSNADCGLKLQLSPLHTLVVTTVHLATQGSKGETLFGMLACLLCLLSHGANPLLKAHISVDLLLNKEEESVNGHVCSHRFIDPVELAKLVPSQLIAQWHPDIQTGWQVFCRVLGLSQANRSSALEKQSSALDSRSGQDSEDESNDEENNDDCSVEYHRKSYFGDSTDLARLWAAVQTEYTTYRRLNEGDEWISPYFEMASLLQIPDPEGGFGSSLGLIRKGLMREEYCECGIFYKTFDEVCVRAEECSTYHFANLEDWNRTTFIDTPTDRGEIWYDF